MAIPSPLELLFPPKCIICQKILTGRETICPECARSLPVATGTQIKHKLEFTEGCYAPFFYEEPLRSSFLRYKFSGREHYAAIFGKWMADCLTGQEQTKFDFVTFAPLSRLRRWRRGYDQAELLAKEIASHLNLPLLPTLTKAYRRPLSRLEGGAVPPIRPDHGRLLSAQRRGCARKSAFCWWTTSPLPAPRSLSACAQILKCAGASEITCVTLAQKASKIAKERVEKLDTPKGRI